MKIKESIRIVCNNCASTKAGEKCDDCAGNGCSCSCQTKPGAPLPPPQARTLDEIALGLIQCSAFERKSIEIDSKPYRAIIAALELAYCIGAESAPQEAGARAEWRCFFCDEVFTDRREAWRHFGEENCESDPPACVDPLRIDEKQRVTELREAREYALKCQNEVNRAEELAEGLQGEHDNFFRYFGPDVNNMWQAGDRYKNALFELETLRAASERGVPLEEKNDDQSAD